VLTFALVATDLAKSLASQHDGLQKIMTRDDLRYGDGLRTHAFSRAVTADGYSLLSAPGIAGIWAIFDPLPDLVANDGGVAPFRSHRRLLLVSAREV